MNNTEIRKLLEAAVADSGFTRRGSAFFRVVGDGVLQLLKFEYERCFSHYNLAVGLFSMYGELDRKWFTSGGCIPRYCVMNFVGGNGAILMQENGSHCTFEVVSPQEQIAVLTNHAMNALNNIGTQGQLVEAICQLDISSSGIIIWNDFEKFAPYLKVRNYACAEKVIQSIIDQNTEGMEFKQKSMNLAEFSAHVARQSERLDHLYALLDMVKRKDDSEVDTYLCANQLENNKHARFCIGQ